VITRRRFLAISAASIASPARAAEVQEWTGTAMGAEVRIVIAGATQVQSLRLFSRLESMLREIEAVFSLHRESELSRLNRLGRLSYPPRKMLDVFKIAGAVHAATNGLFDPSIQPVWLAEALGGDVECAQRLVGWSRVKVSPQEIALEPGMQLTFNGIAQGYAADCIAGLLRSRGFGNVLIDTGETMAVGLRPSGEAWKAAIAMPNGDIVRQIGLSNRALATSSPRGTLIGGGKPHIISPSGSDPRWQLVSVSEASAAIADALSTAFCLMERQAIGAALSSFPDARIEALI
jgi:thiamine biosynthesis lipoprotein